MVTSLKYIRDFISVIYRASCFWKLNQMLKSEISLALWLLQSFGRTQGWRCMVPSTCSEKTWQYSIHLSGCTSHVTNFLVCKHHLTLHRQYLNEWAKQHYQKHYQFCHKMLLQLVIPTTRLGSFAAGHQRTQRLVSMYMIMCVCSVQWMVFEWSRIYSMCIRYETYLHHS